MAAAKKKTTAVPKKEQVTISNIAINIPKSKLAEMAKLVGIDMTLYIIEDINHSGDTIDVFIIKK